ncbi:hypothetical protein Prudu_009087 [Prunus dulcis]|uniref:Ankyrin repeat family protein n=1 Tax=Prunus dulcis TaxID=3755 RepID=A0A4Y1R5K2_PRUDU|nr:hypothetical protein Prudu_009087 [Prunus dulcis]
MVSDCYRFGHPHAAGACGGSWDAMAVGHWVPVQSPICHEHDRVGFNGSWIGVPNTPKSQTLDLIRHRRSVKTAPSSEPLAQPASAATAPALMDHVPVGPGGPRCLRHQFHQWCNLLALGGGTGPPAPPTSHRSTVLVPRVKKNTRRPCRQLKTAKVTQVTNSRISIGYDERHRAAPTPELHSSLAHDIGHIVRTHCPMQWKSWKVMPDEIKMEVCGQFSTNYNLEDLDDESLAYVNRLFAERYKQWKSDLHYHFEAFDDPQVALHEGCPKELEGREDSWAWLCAHFQAPNYVNKAQVNKGNRKKKTLLHHSGSRPFSYRMDARRRRGSKFPKIDVFGDIYIRPGNELAKSLHESASQLPPETLIESVDPPQDAGFQILTETLYQTLGRRQGTYCRGMGNAWRREPIPRSSAQSNSQVTALTAQVATLQGQMSVILQSLVRSYIPVPQFDASTFEPVHAEHAL